jgi:hypothetical protein
MAYVKECNMSINTGLGVVDNATAVFLRTMSQDLLRSDAVRAAARQRLLELPAHASSYAAAGGVAP